MNQILQKNSIALLLSFCFFYSCSKYDEQRQQIDSLYQTGRFSEARQLIGREIVAGANENSVKEMNLLLDKMNRIELDFSKTEAEIKKELQVYFVDLSREQLEEWELSGRLEMKVIDGVKRYFKNAVPNLFRVDSFAKAVKVEKDGVSSDPLKDFCLKNTTVLLEKFQHGSPEDELKKMFLIEYTVTLQPDVVPAGEFVRCWMPFPRESYPRQRNVRLHSANSHNYLIADNSILQRSIYIEKMAVAGQPTVFRYSADFETLPQFVSVKPQKIKPYKTASPDYKKFTAERPPHLIFSPEIIHLAKEITHNTTNPYDKVKAIYYWIDRNIPWTSALEYSTFDCIPHYVLENKKGDCGMKTLLFMSLARSCGIPCKWQSGWMLHPGEVNLHDWCEVYYEGVGWVPLDQSFGLQDSGETALREFYISGIDAYRLIINDDFSCEFEPPKKYYRSEPIDFQRGELEWNGGNLYFNTWSYKMNVTCMNDSEL